VLVLAGSASRFTVKICREIESGFAGTFVPKKEIDRPGHGLFRRSDADRSYSGGCGEGPVAAGP